MRTVRITFTNGNVQEVSGIPEDSKITFGTVHGGGTMTPGGANLCLRIYKGSRDNGNQLAVFQGVESFIDLSLSLSLPVAKKEWIDR